MGGGPVLAVVVLELVGPVDLAVILTEGVPLLIGEQRLEVGILLQIVVPGYQHALVVQGHHGLAAVNEIGIITAGDDGADCLGGSLSGQPGLLHFRADLLRDEVHNLVVVIDFGLWHRPKHCELDDVSVSALAAASHAKKHDSHQHSRGHSLPGCLFHIDPPLL